MMSLTVARAAATALCLLPISTMAATLNFTGEIVSSTCSVSGGGTPLTVPLGRVDASQLATAGERAGLRAFAINLNCSAKPDLKVAVSFESPSINPTTGDLLLANVEGKATNVQIAVYNDTGAKEKFNALPAESSWRAVKQGAATLNYTASYIATGQATAGPANASATFTVVYQ